MLSYLNVLSYLSIPLFIALLIWSGIWKGIGLWKAGRNKQLAWFVAMFIFNTAGLLPIAYIFFFQKNKEVIVIPKAKPKKKPAKKKR